MSLWSYESQLFMILVFPAALLLLRPAWRRWSLATAGWYVVPGAYLCLTAHRYLISRGGGYQESVVRAQWGLISLGQDWWFNIQSSLQFWAWLREPIPLGNVTAVLSVVAALTFFAAGLALFRMEHRPDQSDPPVRTWGLLFASGAVLLALSFPAYLLLASARGLWRTQFLSGIGTGLVWTAVVGLISAAFRQRVMRSIIVLALSAGIVYFGATSAIAKGALHRRQWENHRAMLVGILRIAPKVNPNTIIVLTGVPKNPDPFGHNMWLDLALRLCYPGIPVSGIYYYADGTPSPGSNLEAVGDAWKMQATGFPTLVRDTSLANTIVVEWSTSRPAQLAKSIPDFICHAQCAETLYNPAHVITTPISPIAVNRYHP
jgi:hypothetical protein